ncbi:MAG: hypothetical protein AB8E87_12345 [Prochlorococcus sp.]
MDIHMFSVSANPWSPNPIPQDVSVIQMNIMENDPF